MWPQIAAVVLPSLLILWQADQPDQAVPTAEEINRAIAALGADSFRVRERASEFLWQAGRAAEPALRTALGSDDPEVVARARRILRRFQFGIYPDTPEQIVSLISRYRHGTPAVKLGVLKELLAGGETPTLMALLRTESDGNLRTQLTGELLKDLDKLAGALFIKGDWSKAEQLLQIGATSDAGVRNYAAYLLARGQLQPKISALRNRAADNSNAVDAKLLVYLLRAGGDLPGARSAAGKTSDPSLTAGILFELGDWKQLARLHQDSPEQTTGTSRGGIVDLGYAAAYHRLAGNAAEFDEAVGGIKRLAERKPNKLWYCGETLIINERFQDAVELLKDQRPAAAFEVLCLQLRFREALELAGVSDPRGPYRSWLVEPETGAEMEPVLRRERFSMGLRVASMLFRLNQREEADGLLSELAQAARENKDLSMRELCGAEYRLGLRERAFEHAAVVLSRGWNTSVLTTLFPERQDAAQIWWRFLCRKYPDEPSQVRIGRLRRLLQPRPQGDPQGDDWVGLVEEAERASGALNNNDRGKWLTALGETCLGRGRPRLARSYFEKAAQTAPSVPTLTRLGDLLAEDAQWERAADYYHLAWERDRTKPTALYLKGRALVEAGRESEGRKLIEAARLLPLGNDQTRYQFAEDLHQRGLTEEAVRQWQWTVRTGQFQSWPVTQAGEQLGNATAGRDDLQAAAYWQWPLLRCLRTSTSNLGVEGYLKRVHLIHRSRARALIAAGRIDEALREIQLSHAALPGEPELVIEMVPELEKAGRHEAADELFAKVFAVHQRVCGDFPRSTSHYELARLAVRCRRRLDEALKHADQAVRLDPKNPAYIDTLAELHFLRGDRRRAIELAKRCVELAPQEEHFRRQLERFQIQ